jgi:hypothetical protein
VSIRGNKVFFFGMERSSARALDRIVFYLKILQSEIFK